jgi:1-phosphofructokinase
VAGIQPPVINDPVPAVVFAPSPVITVTVEEVGDEPEVHFHGGGQGVWVARMMGSLGASVTICAALGGEGGFVLRPLIEREGLGLRAIEVETANGAYVHARRSGDRKIIVEINAPRLTRHDLDALYGATLVAAIDAGTCVLTGTVPPVVPPDTFRRLASDLGNNGVQVVADLSGESLAAAVEGRVDLVKVSHEELIRDGYAASERVDDLLAGIERLRALGARDVVVSRAHDPALASFDGCLLEAAFPTVEVLDPRGAGDSMTAALTVARARRLDPEASLRLAVAAGTLNVTRHGLATGQQEDIERLAAEVVVRELEASAPSPSGAG